MSDPLPTYSSETLSRLATPELLRRMTTDEDRVPRNVIDECARRGEEMVAALNDLVAPENWSADAAPGEWWLRLHAVMVLGLSSSESAGFALIAFMRRMERAEDENLQDWLAGYWPALFGNKPDAVIEPLRELAQDRSVDWYMRISAVESVIALGERSGAQALDVALDWAASIAADETENWTLRLMVGGKLLDAPRERHRKLVDDLAARQRWPQDRAFTADEVREAFSGTTGDKPQWQRSFDDPWRFYEPDAIARRQERWAEEDARSTSTASRSDDETPDEIAKAVTPHVRDTPKVGRNDPCPCGSGKKYKRCCLAKAENVSPEELVWRRLRRLLDEHQRAMLRFFVESYGREAIDEAWCVFVADETATFDEESRHLQIFMPWLFHFWTPRPERTTVRDGSLFGAPPSAHYLRRHRNIEPLLRAYLESCLAAPLSAFEIVRADPGRGFLLRDLFTGEVREVTERSASHAMDDGDLVFGQIAEAGGVAILEATQGCVVPPVHRIEVIAFRQRHFPDDRPATRQRVRELHAEIVALYREIDRRIFEPAMPKLHNTDGDPLSLRRVVFDVSCAQEAFDALKHLALGESEDDLLRDAVRDASGRLERVRFPWLKRGNERTPGLDNTLLGTIELDGTRLCAEVNSERREQTLNEIVAKSLGDRARYRVTEIASLDKLLSETGRPPQAAKDHAALAELPEVKAKLRELMAKHYEQWVNDKLPALGNRTPLEAARDPAGREAVEALVLQIERDGSRMNPPLDPEIVRRLRERLQLTSVN